jgi:hypothetical protein
MEVKTTASRLGQPVRKVERTTSCVLLAKVQYWTSRKRCLLAVVCMRYLLAQYIRIRGAADGFRTIRLGSIAGMLRTDAGDENKVWRRSRRQHPVHALGPAGLVRLAVRD